MTVAAVSGWLISNAVVIDIEKTFLPLPNEQLKIIGTSPVRCEFTGSSLHPDTVTFEETDIYLSKYRLCAGIAISDAGSWLDVHFSNEETKKRFAEKGLEKKVIAVDAWFNVQNITETTDGATEHGNFAVCAEYKLAGIMGKHLQIDAPVRRLDRWQYTCKKRVNIYNLDLVEEIQLAIDQAKSNPLDAKILKKYFANAITRY